MEIKNMKWDYESEFTHIGPLSDDGGIRISEDVIENWTLEDLRKKEKELELRVFEYHAKEPPKKHNNKSDYRLWIIMTHDLIDELHEVRDEIEKRKKQK